MEAKSTAPWVPILTSPEPEDIRIFSLVLLAADIAHRITYHDDRHWAILVAPSQADQASQEIAAYTAENPALPDQDPDSSDFIPTFRAQSSLLILALCCVFLQSGPWQENSTWFQAGAGDADAILTNHQYYRLITALSLHADGLHLLGNCALGGFLLHYFFHLLGNGIGLAALLFSATLANLINVVAHGGNHHFVGFSTAVFALIGMLSALNFRRHATFGRIRILIPLMVGAAMLAMVGSAGQHTDLGAHFFGLVTGLGSGYLLGIKNVFALRRSFSLQLGLSLCSAGAIYLAWRLALS